MEADVDCRTRYTPFPYVAGKRGGMAFVQQSQGTCVSLALYHLFVYSPTLRPYLKEMTFDYRKCFKYEPDVDTNIDNFLNQQTRKKRLEKPRLLKLPLNSKPFEYTEDNAVKLLRRANEKKGIEREHPEGLVYLEHEDGLGHVVALAHTPDGYRFIDSNFPERPPNAKDREGFKIHGVYSIVPIRSVKTDTKQDVKDAYDRMSKGKVWQERPNPKAQYEKLQEALKNGKPEENRAEIITRSWSDFITYENYLNNIDDMAAENVITDPENLRKHIKKEYDWIKKKALTKLVENSDIGPVNNENKKKIEKLLDTEIENEKNRTIFKDGLRLELGKRKRGPEIN